MGPASASPWIQERNQLLVLPVGTTFVTRLKFEPITVFFEVTLILTDQSDFHNSVLVARG